MREIESISKKFKDLVNAEVREQTKILFGYPGEAFESVFKRIQKDMNLFEAWVNWKHKIVPSIRLGVLRLIHLGRDDYYKFVQSSEWEMAREKFIDYRTFPIRVQDQSLDEYKRSNKPIVI